MRWQTAILVLVGLIAAHSLGSNLVTESEVIGFWKVDPTNFQVRSRMTPNTFPRPPFPTNLLAFGLWLQKDRSFVASNAPTGFFFNWPATNECRGTWQVGTNWGLLNTAYRVESGTTNWLIPPGPNTTNGYSELTLIFNKPSLGVWSRKIIKFSDGTPSYYLGGVADEKDDTGTYEWSVAIRKQNLDDKK